MHRIEHWWCAAASAPEARPCWRHAFPVRVVLGEPSQVGCSTGREERCSTHELERLVCIVVFSTLKGLPSTGSLSDACALDATARILQKPYLGHESTASGVHDSMTLPSSRRCLAWQVEREGFCPKQLASSSTAFWRAASAAGGSHRRARCRALCLCCWRSAPPRACRARCAAWWRVSMARPYASWIRRAPRGAPWGRPWLRLPSASARAPPDTGRDAGSRRPPGSAPAVRGLRGGGQDRQRDRGPHTVIARYVAGASLRPQPTAACALPARRATG